MVGAFSCATRYLVWTQALPSMPGAAPSQDVRQCGGIETLPFGAHGTRIGESLSRMPFQLFVPQGYSNLVV